MSRKLSAYNRFVRKRMKVYKPRTMAESRKALKAIASEWRQRNPVASFPKKVKAPKRSLKDVMAFSPRAGVISASKATMGAKPSGQLYDIPRGERGQVLGSSRTEFYATFQDDKGKRMGLIVKRKNFRVVGKLRNPDFREGELVRFKGTGETGPKEGRIIEKEEASVVQRLRGQEYYQVRIQTAEGPRTVLVREKSLKTLNPGKLWPGAHSYPTGQTPYELGLNPRGAKNPRIFYRYYKRYANARKAAKRLTRKGYDGQLYHIGTKGVGMVELHIKPGQKIPQHFEAL